MNLSVAQQAQLRHEIKHSDDVNVYRRATALLAVHEGQPVSQVARLLRVTRQSIYKWIATYGETEHELDLKDAERSGRPTLWTQELQRLLEESLQQTPGWIGYPAPHWTVKLLREHLVTRAARQLSEETVRRKLRGLGYVWKRRRYVLPGNPQPDASMTVSVKGEQ